MLKPILPSLRDFDKKDMLKTRSHPHSSPRRLGIPVTVCQSAQAKHPALALLAFPTAISVS